jgi:mono/diheme cytochrome c family protein
MTISFVVSSILAMAAAAGASTHPVTAQSPITPPQVIASMSGRDLFQFYCAACHGPEGRGDGPVVASLKTAPPDLRTIAARRGGQFPSGELRRFVAGEDRLVAAHGSKEMPVWGPIFYSLQPKDRLTQIRIENIVMFIESMQKP